MSISTKHGDTGKTSLIGGKRVSKADRRVEAYGTIDELISVMGFARSICENADVRDRTKAIQRELFTVSAVVAAGPMKRAAKKAAKREAPPAVTKEMVDALTADVHAAEKIEGLLADWALPGGHAAAAAFDVARTICRRAERQVVRLGDKGEKIPANVVAYLNRLSDLLWLFGRRLEKEAGVDSALRDGKHPGTGWSRAW
jgi:cob(I)alamin adenosyltransferase